MNVDRNNNDSSAFSRKSERERTPSSRNDEYQQSQYDSGRMSYGNDRRGNGYKQRSNNRARDNGDYYNDYRSYGNYNGRARERTRDGSGQARGYRDASPDRRYNTRYQQYDNSYDSYNSYNSHNSYKEYSDYPTEPPRGYMEDGTPVKTASNNEPHDEKRKEDAIKRYKKRLESLQNVLPIEKIKVVDSQWGVKPKGFETVTAQRAKLSGLFPLPGYPRPVDFTKLEGAEKDKLMNSNDILNGSSKIDPSDARSSRILILKGVDFNVVSHLKIVDFLNGFLKKVDLDETSTNNIETKWKSKNDENLMIEFKNNICSTIMMAFNGMKLPLEEFKQDEQTQYGKEEEFVLDFSRPGEYVVQSSNFMDPKDDDVNTTIPDSAKKITLICSPDYTDSQIVDELEKIAPVKSFQLLREIGTKISLGIAFVQFESDKNSTIHDSVTLLQEYISKIQGIAAIKSAFFSCIIPGKTSIQDCSIDLKGLKSLVKNEFVPAHPKSKVIQIINIVTAKDLIEDADYRFIERDIREELSKFGSVVSLKIPRPPNDYTPGLIQLNQPGLGKVYVEFGDEETALKAIMGSAGRMYNDRTVLCAFFDIEDYKNGIL